MLRIPRIRLKQDASEEDWTAADLFEAKYRTSEYSTDEARVELLCLKRLLVCTLKYVSFKTERQLVLRRLLRFMKEILPHPQCGHCFEDCIKATREFMQRLRHQKGNNLKTMRIAYSFLKVLIVCVYVCVCVKCK